MLISYKWIFLSCISYFIDLERIVLHQIFSFFSISRFETYWLKLLKEKHHFVALRFKAFLVSLKKYKVFIKIHYTKLLYIYYIRILSFGILISYLKVDGDSALMKEVYTITHLRTTKQNKMILVQKLINYLVVLANMQL